MTDHEGCKVMMDARDIQIDDLKVRLAEVKSDRRKMWGAINKRDMEIKDLQAALAEKDIDLKAETMAGEICENLSLAYKAKFESATKRIEELKGEVRQRSNEDARDIQREVEYDNGMRQRPCCAEKEKRIEELEADRRIFLDRSEKLQAKLKSAEAVVEAARPFKKYILLSDAYSFYECEAIHDQEAGYTLTVHHLVPDKSLCEDWNLAALCQRCHLCIQARINMFQKIFKFVDISDWFKPHLEGFEEWQRGGWSEIHEGLTGKKMERGG